MHQSLIKNQQAEEGSHLWWSPEELEAEEQAMGAKQEAKEERKANWVANSNAIIL